MALSGFCHKVKRKLEVFEVKGRCWTHLLSLPWPDPIGSFKNNSPGCCPATAENTPENLMPVMGPEEVMRIFLNDAPVEIPEETHLTALLEHQGIAPGGTAMAVNNQMVPRGEWPLRVLRQGDNVLLVRAARGG
jgi:sulfur carrier protein